MSFGVTVVANQLSRRIEARADSYSLRLTDAPEPFIGFERGIAVRNVSDPDPPEWLVALLATHPPTVDRIGIAKAFEAARAELAASSRALRRPVVLGQALDALARAPLGVVVLHGVEQLAHEARREVDAGHDDAGDLVVLDLVVDAREGERELVVGMADVGEVRVLAGHVLRLEVDVDVALGALLFVGHGRP